MNVRRVMLAVLLCGTCLARLDAGEDMRLGNFLAAQAGVRRGVCAVVGDARAAEALARWTELTVHGIDPNAAVVAAVRKSLTDRGLYGTRVIVETGPPGTLPYADNLLDAVVVLDAGGPKPSLQDVLRVLRPGGVALLGVKPGGAAALRARLKGEQGEFLQAEGRTWFKATKPAPQGTDDWPHWQHGPDNNPASGDRVICAPYMTQYMATPWFSTMPSISVISGGRMFRAAGHIAIHPREERYLNTIYATNAYNGTLLWTRPIPEGSLAHRSIFVATPGILYLIEKGACLKLDPQTGAELGRITVPKAIAGGGYWQWIAIQDGKLYALMGSKGYEAEIIRRKRRHGAWGWDQLSKGYYEKKYPWGYGSSLVALDVGSGEVLWSHQEKAPIDSRSLCMNGGRLFLHCEGVCVVALDAKTGSGLWRADDPKLLQAITRPHDSGLGFKTTPYAICTAEGLYFGGRGKQNVVGVSADDGRMLWSVGGAYNATNLLAYDGLVFAHIQSCTGLDPLTGRKVKDLGISKRSCARLTASPDSLFHRGSIQGGEGTTRYDAGTAKPTVIHAFRPPCNDGIIPAEGLLTITPWDCDCNLQLMGTVALCPAGEFRLNRSATDKERLTVLVQPSAVKPFNTAPNDWPAYRADATRSCSTGVALPGKAAVKWTLKAKHNYGPSAPVAAGGMVFLGGEDGIVRALDAATGLERWTFHTGGVVRIPPTVANGLAYIGSADGYAYALEAASGRLVWRFRAAPVDRRTMVFGKLRSTWPVHTGVLVTDGLACVAAGMINFDGTHVYALDAVTGRIRWQNNASGHLNRDLSEGVSAQGDLAVCGDHLLLAGGNVTSPGTYRLSDGQCLNSPPGPGWPAANQGSMVCGLFNRYPVLGGRRLFTQPDDDITTWKPFDVLAPDRVAAKLASTFPCRVAPAFGHGVAVAPGRGAVVCCDEKAVVTWIHAPKPDRRSKKPQPQLQSRWQAGSIRDTAAVVVGGNAVLAAGKSEDGSRWMLQAFETAAGTPIWTVPLPGAPVPNGIAVDSAGRIIVVLADGTVMGIEG